MIDKNVVKLNGKTNGFAVYVYPQNDFLKNRKGIELFSNIENAKARVSSLGFTNPLDYKLWIFIDSIQIDFDLIEYFEPYYEYYNMENNEWYFIEPSYLEKVEMIGYYVFEDGDEKKSDSKSGVVKNKEFFGYLKDAINYSIKYPGQNSISRIYRDKYNCLTIEIKGTTAKIHFCSNNQIMDINMKRKEKGQKCIPFNNKVDKFKSIYVYVTRDNYDYSCPNIMDIISYFKDDILNTLCCNYPQSNPRWSPVEIRGYITIN